MDGDENEWSAIRRLFADGEPRTAAEVASATGVDERTATRLLSDLADVGELDRKTIGGTVVWYSTAAPATDVGNGHGAAAGDSGGGSGFEFRGLGETVRTDPAGAEGDLASPVDADLEAALADASVPGASEMMRSWRRDALRAAAEYVAEHGGARSTEVVEAVYPGHRAGYESRDAWWEFVADRLAGLPGIARDGDRWEYRGRRR